MRIFYLNKKNEVFFLKGGNWGRLPFGDKLRSSSFWVKVEVVFHSESAKLYTSFAVKSVFDTFQGQVGSGQVMSDDGNTGNRANSA